MNFTEVIYGIVSRFPKLLFLLVITSDQCSFHSLLFRIIQKQFHFREPNLTFWPFGIITSSPRHSHANYIYYSETHYSSGSRGRARGARPHPSFLDQTEARRAKKNFLRSAPHLSQGLNDRPTTLRPPPPDRYVCIRHWISANAGFCGRLSSCFWIQFTGSGCLRAD